MKRKQPIQLVIIILFTFVLTIDLVAQNPATYICDKFEGKLSDIIKERSFVGDTFRCDVEEQWDMMIMSEINELIISDQYTENYSRRSFSFDSDEFNIINIYVPFEKKTTYFFVAE